MSEPHDEEAGDYTPGSAVEDPQDDDHVVKEEHADVDNRTRKEKAHELIIGDYDYKKLCRPRWNPWNKDNQEPLPFYGREAKLAWLVAAMLGFQHSLAVVGGVIIPGILLGNQDPSGEAGPYLVSYALITSGICTWIQILHTRLCRTRYFLGSGLLCVIGTSFAFLPTAQQSIKNLMEDGKTFDEAYGSLLGVFMVGAVCQSSLSFIPGPVLRKIFPQWLAGLGVFLIGVSLVGVGVKSWGGGDDCYLDPESLCSQVGDSNLPWGSTEYIGLGFLVMTTILVFELFGSPFIRSCSIAFGLLIGYLIAAFTTDRNGDKYTSMAQVQEAPAVLFLWVKTFPVGFYGPAFLPVLVAYLVSTIETYGDTSATAQASGLKADTKKYDEAIQGGLLGDAVNSFISACAMVLPSTTLSQNIGIISLTKVAARIAGYACGIWMLIYGVLGKIGAFFTSIPQPVLGGMSTLLFANIAISGIKVMTTHGIDRRSRFILAVSSSFGLGTIIIPQWFTSGNFLDCAAIESPGVQGLCDAVIITLSTGYAIGCIVALILNGILPAETDDDVVMEDDDETEELTKSKVDDVSSESEEVELSKTSAKGTEPTEEPVEVPSP